MQPRAKAELTKRKRGRPKGSKGLTTKQQRKGQTKSFSQTEKRNLIAGLKKYMPDDLDELQKCVPRRTKAELEEYLERQKFYIKLYHSNRAKAPIEQWSMLAGDLMATENNDYTQNLARVLSIAANFEDHPTPDDTTPDYSAIYSCLSAILQGSELPELGPLECAVILDLLHSLVDTLRRHDTHDQRQIMIWKYMLLRGKVDTANLDKDLQRCRKAIENDFSDFTGSYESNTQPSSACGSAEQAQNNSSTSAPKSAEQAQSYVENDPTNSTNGVMTKQNDQLKNVGLVPSPEKRPNDEKASSSVDTSGTENTGTTEKCGVPKLHGKGRKSLNPDSEKVEEKIPKKPKMFTLNPFCIPMDHLKLKLKPHLVNSTKSAENNPVLVSKLPRHLTSISGIAPGKPGCSTHHTTVVTVESPYTGRRRTAFPKKPKTTEVVVVTPGKEPHASAETLMQNIEAISLQEILKQNKGGLIEIVDSADNQLILENVPDKKRKSQLKQRSNTGENLTSSALKDFVQEATNIEIVNDDQDFIQATGNVEVLDDNPENLNYMEEGGVMIPTTDQQMIDLHFVTQGYELQEINSSAQSDVSRKRNYTYIHDDSEDASQGSKIRKHSSCTEDGS